MRFGDTAAWAGRLTRTGASTALREEAERRRQGIIGRATDHPSVGGHETVRRRTRVLCAPAREVRGRIARDARRRACESGRGSGWARGTRRTGQTQGQRVKRRLLYIADLSNLDRRAECSVAAGSGT